MLIPIIASRFNERIVQALVKGAEATLGKNGLQEQQRPLLWVPGAFELPLAAHYFAQKQDVDAIICLGAVIRGETPHFDYVCDQAAAGIQRVALDHELPVIFGVLTTDNATQAEARSGGHKGNKGEEAAQAALEMVQYIANLTSS